MALNNITDIATSICLPTRDDGSEGKSEIGDIGNATIMASLQQRTKPFPERLRHAEDLRAPGRDDLLVGIIVIHDLFRIPET